MTRITLLAVVVIYGCGSSDEELEGGTGPAALSAFCDKCAQCYTQPGFNEGFCTPFINGGQFNRLTCSTGASPAELDSQNVTLSQLRRMSCAEFDDQQ